MTLPYDAAELSRADPAHGDAAARRRPRSATGAPCSCRATSARTPSSPGSSTAWPPSGELSRMTQFKDKGRGPGVGERRAVRLPGAHGRRHPRLRHRRGPRGRRPAPAPRAHPRRRDPLQPPLRRHARRARGRDPAGRRARIMDLQKPTAKMSKSADSPQGTIALLDDPQGDHEAHQVRGHRLRDRGALRPRRQARRVEPAPDPRRDHRAVRSPTSRPSSRRAATATSSARSPTRSSSSSRRSRRATRSSPPTPREVDAVLGAGAAKAEAIADDVLVRVRRAAGLLPASDRPSARAVRAGVGRPVVAPERRGAGRPGAGPAPRPDRRDPAHVAVARSGGPATGLLFVGVLVGIARRRRRE